MSDVVEKIESRGYWDVEVRPLPVDANRFDYEELESVIEGTAVRLRGWPVPFIDHREPWLRGDDWIGQDIDALMVSHLEAWRLFTTGQFVHLRALPVDWGDADLIAPRISGQKVIPVWEILFYLTEVVELAARLTLKANAPGSVSVGAKLCGMAGRGLVVGQRNRAEFMRPYVQQQDVLRAQRTVKADDLVAEPREAALELARHFFVHFGWKAPIDQLRAYQQELNR